MQIILCSLNTSSMISQKIFIICKKMQNEEKILILWIQWTSPQLSEKNCDNTNIYINYIWSTFFGATLYNLCQMIRVLSGNEWMNVSLSQLLSALTDHAVLWRQRTWPSTEPALQHSRHEIVGGWQNPSPMLATHAHNSTHLQHPTHVHPMLSTPI